MVEVFKTNVASPEHSEIVLSHLATRLPHCRINFDLDDCDRVLRVEGEDFAATHVIKLVEEKGFACEELL